MRLPTACRS